MLDVVVRIVDMKLQASSIGCFVVTLATDMFLYVLVNSINMPLQCHTVCGHEFTVGAGKIFDFVMNSLDMNMHSASTGRFVGAPIT